MRSWIAWLLITGCFSAAVEAPPVLPPPSVNAGRTGTYEVQTKTAGYSYFVCVPNSYGSQSVAGLHLFFHGQNGQGNAGNFDLFRSALLEPFCLIGINMAYGDGDNGKDTDGKVAVARQAVLQVMADYRIVAGRAVVGCFSGGGLPCGQWYTAAGKTRGLGWPFSVVALYGANFRLPVTHGSPTGWMVGLAKDEIGLSDLYASQTARFGEILKLTPQLGLDQRFVLPNGGHGVHQPEIAATARIFKRMDLFYGQFLVPADWSEKPLASIAEMANAGALGAAATALAKLTDAKLVDAKVALERRAALTAAIDERAQALVAMVGDLVDADPLLAPAYAALAVARLKKHPREAELKLLVGRLAKDRQRLSAAAVAQKAVTAGWGDLFAGGARLTAKGQVLLQQVLAASGPTSELGAMATELLTLPVASETPRSQKR